MGRIVARASSGVGLLFRIKPRDIKAGKSNALKMPATTVRMMPSSTEATKRIQKPPKRNARGPGATPSRSFWTYVFLHSGQTMWPPQLRSEERRVGRPQGDDKPEN